MLLTGNSCTLRSLIFMVRDMMLRSMLGGCYILLGTAGRFALRFSISGMEVYILVGAAAVWDIWVLYMVCREHASRQAHLLYVDRRPIWVFRGLCPWCNTVTMMGRMAIDSPVVIPYSCATVYIAIWQH